MSKASALTREEHQTSAQNDIFLHDLVQKLVENKCSRIENFREAYNAQLHTLDLIGFCLRTKAKRPKKVLRVVVVQNNKIASILDARNGQKICGISFFLIHRLYLIIFIPVILLLLT